MFYRECVIYEDNMDNWDLSAKWQWEVELELTYMIDSKELKKIDCYSILGTWTAKIEAIFSGCIDSENTW